MKVLFPSVSHTLQTTQQRPLLSYPGLRLSTQQLHILSGQWESILVAYVKSPFGYSAGIELGIACMMQT